MRGPVLADLPARSPGMMPSVRADHVPLSTANGAFCGRKWDTKGRKWDTKGRKWDMEGGRA
jgi:hypothetical protein